MTAPSVYIATTRGPSEILRLAPEEAGLQSVVCLNRSSTTLPISHAYDQFVRKPSGIIEREFGHGSFRVDLSDPVEGGSSWQLALYAAHTLLRQGKSHSQGLPNSPDAAQAIWLSGEVDGDLRVHPVAHLQEKLKNSAPLFAELRQQGGSLRLFVAKQNYEEITAEWLQQAGVERGELVALQRADELEQWLTDGAMNGAKITTPQRSQKRWRWVAAAVLSVAAVMVVVLRTPLHSPTAQTLSQSHPHSVAAEAPGLQLFELRAPAEKNCAAVRFGVVKAERKRLLPTTRAPLLYHSSGSGQLCGMVYRGDGEVPLRWELVTTVEESTPNSLHKIAFVSRPLVPKEGSKVEWLHLFSGTLRSAVEYQMTVNATAKAGGVQSFPFTQLTHRLEQ